MFKIFQWIRRIKVIQYSSVSCGIHLFQGFSYFSEVGARGLLNLGEKVDHQTWGKFVQSKITGLPL